MERELSSSDDDEEEGGDRCTLVPQNETKPNHNHRHFPTFEIGDLPSRFRRGFWAGGKKYLLLILLPLFLFLVLYFSLSLDLRSLFNGVSILPAANSPSDRMREAELHALFLLKSQQSALLTIWNQTLATGSNSTTSNSTSDDFRSAILDQIKLNKQIQKALLSSHRSGNSSEEGFDENVGDEVFSNGIDLCRKVDLAAERRTIEWNPKKDRYLFAVCLSGQMSNHLICLEKHMFFAALLDRVLIFPSHKVDYKYDEVLDIENINKCFGKKVVIPFDEFAERKKNKMRIDRFICYTASPPCYLDEEHIKRLKALGISLGKIEAAWPEDAKVKTHKKRVVGDITLKFTSDEEVIAVGDLFYANVEEEWVMQPGGPLAHKCKTVIQPSRLIVLTAQRFVQTFLGSNFIALHFRRHGFLKFCNAKEESCFFPIPQAAECILRAVGRANAPIIYLSTDAAESETDLLQSLLVLNDAKAVPLVKRPSHTSVEKWDALLYRNQLGGNSQVEAMLDKTISAMSNVFIGAPGSTFTEDILRLRRGWGSASRCDEYLCRGELPNFIAEND